MSAPGVVIVPSGGANLASLCLALERLGVSAAVSAEPETLRRASHVILPGVGAAGDCMARLRQAGLPEVLRRLRQPVLGICAGMQIMFEASAEGDTACLGIFPGRVERLPGGSGIAVPHMGWNQLRRRAPTPLLAGVDDGAYVYFVHSFAAAVSATTAASSDHGTDFAAVTVQDNFAGVQFHPERSAAVGAAILRNFVAAEGSTPWS